MFFFFDIELFQGKSVFFNCVFLGLNNYRQSYVVLKYLWCDRRKDRFMDSEFEFYSRFLLLWLEIILIVEGQVVQVNWRRNKNVYIKML